MLRLLKLIFLCLYISAFSVVQAQENTPITLELQEDEPESISPRDAYDSYLEDVDYFDKKYPGTSIEEDFIADVEERHPEFAPESSALRENFLRKTVKLQRVYNEFKLKIQDFLLSQNIPITVDNSQYESGEAVAYLENDGKALVIKDFKKVIAYADNPQDRAAAEDKAARDAGLPTRQENIEKMKQAFLDRDWKTIFTYGLFDGKNTLEDMRGLGEWQGSRPEARTRIILGSKVVDSASSISGAVQIDLPPKSFLLGQKYQNNLPLSVQIETSDNVEKLSVNMPVLQRFYINPEQSVAGYAGLITIPFELKLKNSNQAVWVKAAIRASLCIDDQCTFWERAPRVEIAAVAEKDAESRAAPFLRLIKPYYPQAERQDIEITALEIETSVNPSEPQILRAIVEADDKPLRVDAFLENEMANQFSGPLIRIDGKKIVIRFKAKNSKIDYIGKPFELTVATAPKIVLRQSLKAQPLSPFSSENNRLSLGLVWFAFLGGLILNFMPCVFPVLSLKLLAFTRFGGVKREHIRRDFLLNVLGIFGAFVLLVIALAILKAMGYALGWGMQFQSIGFISVMTFVIALFIAQTWGLINLRLPEFVNRFAGNSERGQKLTQFLTGIFLVLLATPCTAPYLGTALGFALAGSMLDIIVILGFVALGLALPYLLVAWKPGLAYYMPRPGKWMRWFELLISGLLLLTLGWLISLLAAQGGRVLIWHYSAFVGLIWVILYLRKLFMQELERQEKDPQNFLRVRRLFNIVSTALVAAVIVWGIYDAKRKVQIQAAPTPQIIDEAKIKNHLKDGYIVLLKIGADWCLTCHYNDALIFNTAGSKELFAQYKIIPLEIDWSRYNADVLEFMSRYGRKGLPFYVVYSPRTPDGQVLPEVLNNQEFEQIIRNLR